MIEECRNQKSHFGRDIIMSTSSPLSSFTGCPLPRHQMNPLVIRCPRVQLQNRYKTGFPIIHLSISNGARVTSFIYIAKSAAIPSISCCCCCRPTPPYIFGGVLPYFKSPHPGHHQLYPQAIRHDAAQTQYARHL